MFTQVLKGIVIQLLNWIQQQSQLVNDKVYSKVALDFIEWHEGYNYGRKDESNAFISNIGFANWNWFYFEHN